MKTFLTTALFLCTMLLFSRDIQVNVTIQNLTGDTLLVNFYVGDNVADPSASVYKSRTMTPGELQWNFMTEKDIENFSVVYGSAVILKNGLPSGKITGESKVVSKNDNDFSWDIEIDNSNRRSLSDLSAGILQYNPSQFINTDVTPKPLDALFNQYLGALQAFRISSEGDTIYEYRIAPIDLNLNAQIGEIRGTQTSSTNIDFLNLTNQKLGVSIPAITELGLNFENNRMHSIKLEYKDIGIVDWIKTPSMSDDATTDIYLNNVPSLDQIELGKLSFQFGDSLKLKRIDKAYIFDGIYIEHNEGSRSTGSNELTLRKSYELRILGHGLHGIKIHGFFAKRT